MSAGVLSAARGHANFFARGPLYLQSSNAVSSSSMLQLSLTSFSAPVGESSPFLKALVITLDPCG